MSQFCRLATQKFPPRVPASWPGSALHVLFAAQDFAPQDFAAQDFAAQDVDSRKKPEQVRA